jgi:4'-phosphopantetheinyl transferase
MDRAVLKFDPVRFVPEEKPTPLIEIPSGVAQVWGFILDVDGVDRTTATRCLSREEVERADRVTSDRHRQQFIAAHVALRTVLSRYCGRLPHALVLQKTSEGKPFLTGTTAIRFNLTHSHGRALIAVTGDREVGVDLEKLRPEIDVMRLTDRFLSSSDRAFIEGGDPAQRHTRFLQAWVIREAVFKAEGSGMRFPLHHDHVELSEDGRTARLVRGSGRLEGKDLSVRFLSLEPGWVGAVAAEGTDWTVTYRSFGGS